MKFSCVAGPQHCGLLKKSAGDRAHKCMHCKEPVCGIGTGCANAFGEREDSLRIEKKCLFENGPSFFNSHLAVLCMESTKT